MLFSKFDLPKPSTKLISLVREVTRNSPTAFDSLNWHKKIQPSHINCVAGNFFYNHIVNLQVEKEFQPFFSKKLVSILGTLRNTTGAPECYPAHTDRNRAVHLNYYIDLGGDVSTVFYDKVDPIDDTEGGHVLSHNSLPKVVASVKFEANQWYVFSSRNYHSVENITSERCILGICFKDVLLEDFLKEYQSRIID